MSTSVLVGGLHASRFGIPGYQRAATCYGCSRYAAFAALIARHTLSGVAGISICFTPSSFASMTPPATERSG